MYPIALPFRARDAERPAKRQSGTPFLQHWGEASAFTTAPSLFPYFHCREFLPKLELALRA